MTLSRLHGLGSLLRSQRVRAAVLAVLLPLAVLTVALLVLHGGPVSAEQADALARAAQVMNGQRLQQSVVSRMGHDLDTQQPEVLVLGSSYAHTNLDHRTLARRIGQPTSKVVVFSVPNSVASHWYAILEHRVFEQGHRPPIVLVVTSLRSMLVSQPYTPASHSSLTVHMEEHEPVLDRYVRRADSSLEHLRERRVALRDAVVSGLGLSSARLLFGGAEASRTALQRVFHDSHLDHGQHRPLLVTDVGRNAEHGNVVDDLPHPDASLLPELARLAAEHGTQLVFVRTPMAPRTPAARQDLVAPGTAERVEQILGEHGHLYVDLWEDPLDELQFHDLKHMQPESAIRFTQEVVDRVRARRDAVR
jgi:hypothetical protein